MCPQSNVPVLRVRVTGQRPALLRFLSEHPLEIDSVKCSEGLASFATYLSAELQPELARHELQFEVLFDASARGGNLRQSTNTPNRFDGGRIPSGYGLLEE